VRIVVANTFGRALGGIESYLSRVIPALRLAAHEVAMLFEYDAPRERPRVANSDRTWCVSEVGIERTLCELRAWQPDIVYTHGMSDQRLEQMMLETLPAVHFAHDYSALCISKRKAFGFPSVRTCTRPFGWQCLLHYFPHRCGGLNPITMWQQYRGSIDRRKLMQRYRRILVPSEAMRQEYLRNWFQPDRVETLLHPVPTSEEESLDCESGEFVRRASGNVVDETAPPYPMSHLLFAGRMVQAKGGAILLAALPHAAAILHRPLYLTLAGDGPARLEWERQARNLCERDRSMRVVFTGWQEGANLQKLFEASDLLVVPSLWPEPFGLIGPEAGMTGLPAAAFDVGGISEWLQDGINGFVAPATPPTAHGLAAVITKCLGDESRYQELRKGARREAAKFGLEQHVRRLLAIFADCSTTRKSGIKSARSDDGPSIRSGWRL
jgi:glycosyltransferase involved in cell wall biosynthesis